MPKILLTNKYAEEPLSIIKEIVPDEYELIYPEVSGKDELIRLIPRADYLIVSGREKIDKELLEGGNKLKMIQRTGVGTDMLDIEEIKSRALPLYVNKGVNACSVAEHTILLMLASLRRLNAIDNELKSGIWKKQENGIKTYEIFQKNVALIGLGNIGKKVARVLNVLGANVKYYDLVPLSEEEERDLGIQFLPFEEIIKEGDIISLHCPLTKETKALISKKTIEQMKDRAILVNTARGGLVDQADLLIALKEGKIGFAALDVFESEPLPANSALLASPNILLTPHIGGVTKESFQNMFCQAVKNIMLFENGNIEEIKESKII
ncbi:MAG: 2-hydroxyacid dehydrogenase [Anaerovoracaceae bacterium]